MGRRTLKWPRLERIWESYLISPQVAIYNPSRQVSQKKRRKRELKRKKRKLLSKKTLAMSKSEKQLPKSARLKFKNKSDFKEKLKYGKWSPMHKWQETCKQLCHRVRVTVRMDLRMTHQCLESIDPLRSRMMNSKTTQRTRWESDYHSTGLASKECSSKHSTTTIPAFIISSASSSKNISKLSNMNNWRPNMEFIWKIQLKIY